ncbi:MAG: class I SAM-dependent methyltransferase [Deltaproteobacteria bacterium]|nr:class I SAM-dependent methyltransferase [Deltaproteobacteria bacterium]
MLKDVANFEKYTQSGKIGDCLIKNFYNSCFALLETIQKNIENVFEVGSGEGISTQHLHLFLGSEVVYEASEFRENRIAMIKKRNPLVNVSQETIYSLSKESKSIDLVICLEVLEHLEDPQKALKELSRITKKYVLISTPREPLWSWLNICRGKYVSGLGNTPSHIQRWSSRGLVEEVDPWFELSAMRKPLPWTILLLKPKV